MKILSFLDSIELNQLRLNMGADLVEKIDRGFYSTPLDLVSYKKVSNNFENPNNTKKISISLKSPKRCFNPYLVNL